MRRLLVPALLVLLALPATAAQVRHSFESSISRGNVNRVVVDVPAGDVTIRNGSADRIAVSGYVTRDPDTDRNREKEQRIVDDSSVIVVATNGEATIKRKFGPQADTFRGSMFSKYHVEIRVPAGVDLDVLTRYGDINIEGRYGDVDVDLRAGDIDVRVPKKDVRELTASTRIGDVEARLGDEVISREGIFPGKTRYVNKDGKSIITVHVTTGDVRVDLVE